MPCGKDDTPKHSCFSFNDGNACIVHGAWPLPLLYGSPLKSKENGSGEAASSTDDADGRDAVLAGEARTYLLQRRQ